MNVVVSGLTAAGKTTHCKLLAEFLGYDYFSASTALRDLMDNPGDESYWNTEWDLLRESGELDRRLDERMLAELESRHDTVFDAWALPWTSKSSALRIWLHSDLASRANKVVVSRLRSGETLSVDEGLTIAKEKDRTSREMFLEHHAFDLFQDHDLFDLSFDLSTLISEPSVRASDIGIGCASHVIHAIVGLRLGRGTSERGLSQFQRSLIL